METIILGNGALGRASRLRSSIAAAPAGVLGRPAGGAHSRSRWPTARSSSTLREARPWPATSRPRSRQVAAGVLATTGWDGDRSRVERLLVASGAAAVAAPNLSLGAALFFRLVEAATDLFGSLEAFDPYLVEWHRRTKADRPSGTARELSRRLIARHPRKRRVAEPGLGGPPAADELEVAVIRAGASPGMHLVGFDAPGETVELRITARDRSAYAAGALAAADWLVRRPRDPGLHSFDAVVDELLARPALVATA